MVGNCVSCHNGTLTATGKQRQLIFRLRNVCEDCHSTASWSSGATFDHAERGGELRELSQRSDAGDGEERRTTYRPSNVCEDLPQHS